MAHWHCINGEASPQRRKKRKSKLAKAIAIDHTAGGIDAALRIAAPGRRSESRDEAVADAYSDGWYSIL